MKIGISASSDSLDANVDSRFGRCPFFVILDSETMESKVIRNDSANSAHGAGIQAAQTIANAGVEAVITGNIGPNAFNVLTAAGIKTVTGASGSVRDAVKKYKNGQLVETERPTVGNHSNMRRG